jgi:hypothetical protein
MKLLVVLLFCSMLSGCVGCNQDCLSRSMRINVGFIDTAARRDTIFVDVYEPASNFSRLLRTDVSTIYPNGVASSSFGPFEHDGDGCYNDFIVRVPAQGMQWRVHGVLNVKRVGKDRTDGDSDPCYDLVNYYVDGEFHQYDHMWPGMSMGDPSFSINVYR